MSMEDNLGPQFVRAADLQVGHYTSHRGRIAKIASGNGKVRAQIKVQGSNAPGIAEWDEDQQVRVYPVRGKR